MFVVEESEKSVVAIEVDGAWRAMNENGVEVPTPTFPLVTMNCVVVATPVEDDAMRKDGVVGARSWVPMESRPHGLVVPTPSVEGRKTAMEVVGAR